MSIELVRRYLASGFDDVPGWCNKEIMEVMGHLAEDMTAAGVEGGACEIGVFQGKFIIGLSHAVGGRPCLAIDLFDNQGENIDKSGAGTADMLTGFRANVVRHGYSTIQVMAANSFGLNIRDRVSILDRFGPFQFFSIDGGHLAEHVVNDYRFAEDVTHQGGAIIIDDISNPGWPGVMEGANFILANLRPKFVPLLIGRNKLVLVGLTFHRRYLNGLTQRLRTEMPSLHFSMQRFFGYELISLT